MSDDTTKEAETLTPGTSMQRRVTPPPNTMEHDDEARAREFFEVYRAALRNEGCSMDGWEHQDDKERAAWLAVADHATKRASREAV